MDSAAAYVALNGRAAKGVSAVRVDDADNVSEAGIAFDRFDRRLDEPSELHSDGRLSLDDVFLFPTVALKFDLARRRR